MTGLDSLDRLPDDAIALLHEVAMRGRVALDDDRCAAALDAAGLARRTTAYLVLTPAGRQTHARWARLPAGTDAEATARRAYEGFVPMNAEALKVCTDWQVRPGNVPNDHTDAAYDWAVVDRLRALDERAGPVVARLGRTVARFAGYRPRLRDALRRVDDGAPEWLASPTCDSYHTVWMQLHEDLLLALGLERASEDVRVALP